MKDRFEMLNHINISVTNRIEYIDALRGFTMLLVIYSHIITWGYNIASPFLYNDLFVKFRMPLFFFISGWVLYKRNKVWNIAEVLPFLGKKFMVQIIPTAFFMIIYLYINSSFHKEAFGSLKSGYWFTISLFQYFIIYTLSRLLVCRCEKFGWVENTSVIFFAVLTLIFSYTYGSFARYYSLNGDLFEYVGCFQWRFYVFFCIGTLVKKYYDKFTILTDSSSFMTLVLFGIIFMFLFSDYVQFVYWEHLSFVIWGLLGIICVLTFFRKHSVVVSKNNFVGAFLQFVGRRTLDIYLLHYFLLPRHLNFLNDYLLPNPILGFFITLLLALMVLSISMVISEFLRLSPFIAHYLFGVKYK